MPLQRGNGVELTRKRALAQACVDFLVANVVQQYRRPLFAPFGARDQMMQALRNIRRNGPPTKRANRGL